MLSPKEYYRKITSTYLPMYRCLQCSPLASPLGEDFKGFWWNANMLLGRIHHENIPINNSTRGVSGSKRVGHRSSTCGTQEVREVGVWPSTESQCFHRWHGVCPGPCSLCGRRVPTEQDTRDKPCSSQRALEGWSWIQSTCIPVVASGGT